MGAPVRSTWALSLVLSAALCLTLCMTMQMLAPLLVLTVVCVQVSSVYVLPYCPTTPIDDVSKNETEFPSGRRYLNSDWNRGMLEWISQIKRTTQNNPRARSGGNNVAKTIYNVPCESSCHKLGYNYYWCRLANGDWDYCSPSCTSTRCGQSCGNECAHRGEDYYWCDVHGDWEYCSPC